MEKIFSNFKIDTKYGALAANAMPIIVFGGFYIAWAYLSSSWRRKHKARVLGRSISISILHRGDLAFKRLIEYQEARANPESLEIADCQLKTALAEEKPNFSDLQTIIGKMEMSGKEDNAVQILEKAYVKAKNEGRPHEAYEFEMLLVEMLIYKGDFLPASHRDCLRDDEKISDARRPLYLAIIHIMMNRPDNEVKECWKKFEELRKNFNYCSSLHFQESDKLSTDLKKFKSLVLTLKDDIDEVQGKKIQK